jgi:hypothetical protein
MPARSVSDAKSRATHEAAMAIIAGERKRRDEKTARLRAAREAAEHAGTGQPGKDRSGKTPGLRKK